jgi:hypothetical protein
MRADPFEHKGVGFLLKKLIFLFPEFLTTNFASDKILMSLSTKFWEFYCL